MKLLFKQRFFSWFDSYDIFDEAGQTVYTIQGKLDWGHCLHILNAAGEHIGTVQEKILTFLPKFELFVGEQKIGEIRQEWTLFRPRFTLDCGGWTVVGDWMEWNYVVQNASGNKIAGVEKQIWNWTDTYVLDIVRPEDALRVLMVALAIDAEKCGKN